jgi:primary-amine oxidase
MRIQQCWRYSLLFALPLLVSAQLSGQSKPPQHPLEGLSTDEYWTVHDVLQKSGHITDKTLTSSLLLHEPAKDKVIAWKEGDPILREADVILLDDGKTVEARVDIGAQKLEYWNIIPGVQAPVTASEFGAMGEVVKKDPRVLAAMKLRNITDLTTVNCGAGPLSFLLFPEQDSQRIGWGGCTDIHGAYHSWAGRSRESISSQT